MGKLLISETFREARDAGTAIIGAAATVTGPDSVSEGWVQELTVFSPAPAIYGGTDQIQRNILAERVLGLPRL
jgi:alkylation response protein AidB-like acyl-CoA dehydrogenase